MLRPEDSLRLLLRTVARVRRARYQQVNMGQIPVSGDSEGEALPPKEN